LTKTNTHIVLVGNPNCGKSTVFNRLTGLRQKISNLPGTTVEEKNGLWKTGSQVYEITDLPGIYSLSRTQTEEGLVRRKLLKMAEDAESYTLVLVVDESNLRRNLLLVHQVLQLNMKCILLLNMSDVARRRNKSVDALKLQEILGIPILKINGKTGIGINEIEALIPRAATSDWSQADGDASIEKKYMSIEKVMTEVIKPSLLSHRSITKMVDKVATHKIGGFLLLFIILTGLFQVVFTVAAYPSEWIENGFTALSQWVEDGLGVGTFSSLISHGIIPGISGIMVFIPQIALLFLLIGILEDSGYLTRVSYISDYPMRKLGLTGKSVIPLLGGFACAIPGIMSTRTIANKYERLLTMFVLPLMACSARLPVYSLIISLCIPKVSLGFIGLQSLVMTSLYMSGIVLAAIISFGVRRFIKNSVPSDFILELPSYQMPQLKNLWNAVYFKCKSFVLEAGKIILVISVILWAMASYGPPQKMQQAHNMAAQEAILAKLTVTQAKALDDKYSLEQSYAGQMGKFIEPAIAPLGFDWKTGIGIISSFAAREVFVGTMGTIFNLEDKENTKLLRDKMASSTNDMSSTGKYGLAYGVSLLLFYAFAMQCASTVSVMYKESGSLKLTLLQLIGYSGIAYLAAWVAYSILA
jgi:ferrous iron transport protein B